MKNIILASKSIDRSKLFQNSKIIFSTLITEIDEDKYKLVISHPQELVKQLAKAKALAAKKNLEFTKNDSIIVAGDTIIELNGKIIGKATDENNAYEILKQLSNNTHNLITGIAVTETFNPKMIVDYESTSVKFTKISDENIWAYIKSGEWKGRAGAYSIGERASLFIELIKGSPSNVVGLPMNLLYKILKKEFNLDLLEI
ncbi:MAG TPA: nucleoside triphosphate pyrophosphatase [Candidatus Lokiarchaeia archaeon]